jgi:hypothetical protein
MSKKQAFLTLILKISGIIDIGIKPTVMPAAVPWAWHKHRDNQAVRYPNHPDPDFSSHSTGEEYHFSQEIVRSFQQDL